MFYCFNQNNSGGWFKQDDQIAHYMFIEADSADEANERAESVGIYFDGCSDGRDCDCCGDRWSRAWRDEGEAEPLIYKTPVAQYEDMWTPEGKAYAYVYHKDGTKEAYYSK